MINFKEYSDEKIKDFISVWEVCVQTRILNPYPAYQAAVKELATRGYDIDVEKLTFFEKHQDATIEHFYEWLAELKTLCDLMCPDWE